MYYYFTVFSVTHSTRESVAQLLATVSAGFEWRTPERGVRELWSAGCRLAIVSAGPMEGGTHNIKRKRCIAPFCTRPVAAGRDYRCHRCPPRCMWGAGSTACRFHHYGGCSY